MITTRPCLSTTSSGWCETTPAPSWSTPVSASRRPGRENGTCCRRRSRPSQASASSFPRSRMSSSRTCTTTMRARCRIFPARDFTCSARKWRSRPGRPCSTNTSAGPSRRITSATWCACSTTGAWCSTTRTPISRPASPCTAFPDTPMDCRRCACRRGAEPCCSLPTRATSTRTSCAARPSPSATRRRTR